MNWFASQINILERLYNIITGTSIKKEIEKNESEKNETPVIETTILNFEFDKKFQTGKNCSYKNFLNKYKDAIFDEFETEKRNGLANVIAPINAVVEGDKKICNKCLRENLAGLLLRKLTLANLECTPLIQKTEYKKSGTINVAYLPLDVTFFGVLYCPPNEVDKLKGCLCIKDISDNLYIIAKQKDEIFFIKINEFEDKIMGSKYFLGEIETPKKDFNVCIIPLDYLFYFNKKDEENIYNENAESFDISFLSYNEILKSDEDITEFYYADIFKAKAKKEEEIIKKGWFRSIFNGSIDYSLLIKISTFFIVIIIWRQAAKGSRKNKNLGKANIL